MNVLHVIPGLTLERGGPATSFTNGLSAYAEE